MQNGGRLQKCDIRFCFSYYEMEITVDNNTVTWADTAIFSTMCVLVANTRIMIEAFHTGHVAEWLLPIAQLSHASRLPDTTQLQGKCFP